MDFQRVDPYLLHGQRECQDKSVLVLEPYECASLEMSLEMSQSLGHTSDSIQENFSPRHVPTQNLRYDSTITSNNVEYRAPDTHSFPSANGQYVLDSHGPYQGYGNCPRAYHRYRDTYDTCPGNNPNPGSGRAENLEYTAFPQLDNGLCCETGFHIESPQYQSHLSGHGGLVPVKVAGDFYSQVSLERPLGLFGSSPMSPPAMDIDPSTYEAGDQGVLSSVPMQRDKELVNTHPPCGHSGSTLKMCQSQSDTPGNINDIGSASELMSQSLFPRGITPPGSHSVHKVNLDSGNWPFLIVPCDMQAETLRTAKSTRPG